jgi:hypothetical protein
MPRDSARALQLPLFVRDTVVSPEALARYEAIRPILKGEQSLRPSLNGSRSAFAPGESPDCWRLIPTSSITGSAASRLLGSCG